MGRVRSFVRFPNSQTDEVSEKKIGNEEWYGGKENAR